jgi:hypothetical protein
MRQLPLKEKCKNFWFYYKVHLIVGVLAFIAIWITAVECANRVDYDVSVSYYNINGVTQDKVDALAQLLKEQSEDINGNGTVDVQVTQSYADITRTEFVDQMIVAVMQRLQAEIYANSCPAYIVDEAFRDRLLNVYPEIIDQVIELSANDEVKERLKLTDEKLYLVTVVEYDGSKGNMKLMAIYEQVRSWAEYFKK